MRQLFNHGVLHHLFTCFFAVFDNIGIILIDMLLEEKEGFPLKNSGTIIVDFEANSPGITGVTQLFQAK